MSSNKSALDLKLYYFEGCPYCQKVLKFIDKHNINIKLKNIHKDKNAKLELINVGGKNQVPCLFINDKPLYESDEIIKWLKNNKM